MQKSILHNYNILFCAFEIRVGHSHGFGLPSLAILPWICRKRRIAIFTPIILCIAYIGPMTLLKIKNTIIYDGLRSQWVRIPVGWDVYHETVQRPGVCSFVHGTVHYKESLKAFRHSPDLGHPVETSVVFVLTLPLNAMRPFSPIWAPLGRGT